MIELAPAAGEVRLSLHREKLKTSKTIALLVFSGGVPVALWIAIRLLPAPLTPPAPVTNAELVTILLTGVTVALAVLAILVGAIAIWGASNIIETAERKAKETAEQTATKGVSDHLKENLGATVKGELPSILKRPDVQSMIASEVREALQAQLNLHYADAFARPMTEETGETSAGEGVGDPYPDSELTTTEEGERASAENAGEEGKK